MEADQTKEAAAAAIRLKNAALQEYQRAKECGADRHSLRTAAVRVAQSELLIYDVCLLTATDARPNLVSAFSLLADALRYSGMDPNTILNTK